MVEEASLGGYIFVRRSSSRSFFTGFASDTVMQGVAEVFISSIFKPSARAGVGARCTNNQQHTKCHHHVS
jgi:hypothetical protein